MPIPAASSGRSDAAPIVLAQFLQLHNQVRAELAGLDDGGMNWVPAPGANSITTIVMHLIGSEVETLRCVAGLPCERDRDAEFSGQKLGVSEVMSMLDDADALITQVGPLIDAERTMTMLSLPILPPEEKRSGLTWLIGNYGHAREHLGQMQLTKELCLQS
jgi:hypothetical protein